jgi:Uma2 family endonuclease
MATTTLLAYIGANPQLGLQVFAEAPSVATGRDTLVPDASVVGKGRLHSVDEKYVTSGPDLAISVWVVYPDAESVAIYSGDSVRGDQKIEDPLLPGFSVPVASFFDLT